MSESIESIKKKVGQLVKDKGLSYNYLSTTLGMNPSYLQKFVKEKSPQRLDEKFRKSLAKILEVSEQELTDIPLNTQIKEYFATDDLYNQIASVVKIVEDFQNDHHLKVEAEKKAQLIAGLVVKLLETPINQQEEVIKFAIDWELNKQVV